MLWTAVLGGMGGDRNCSTGWNISCVLPGKKILMDLWVQSNRCNLYLTWNLLLLFDLKERLMCLKSCLFLCSSDGTIKISPFHKGQRWILAFIFSCSPKSVLGFWCFGFLCGGFVCFSPLSCLGCCCLWCHLVWVVIFCVCVVRGVVVVVLIKLKSFCSWHL